LKSKLFSIIFPPEIYLSDAFQNQSNYTAPPSRIQAPGLLTAGLLIQRLCETLLPTKDEKSMTSQKFRSASTLRGKIGTNTHFRNKNNVLIGHPRGASNLFPLKIIGNNKSFPK
jgi:hypothetical protein